MLGSALGLLGLLEHGLNGQTRVVDYDRLEPDSPMKSRLRLGLHKPSGHQKPNHVMGPKIEWVQVRIMFRHTHKYGILKSHIESTVKLEVI